MSTADIDYELVRNVVAGTLRRRFHNVSQDRLDDVLGEVMVDLLGYWSQLPSSQAALREEPEKAAAFAIRRGVWTGASELTQTFRRNEAELLLSPLAEENDTASDGSFNAASPLDWACGYSRSAEDEALDNLEPDDEQSLRSTVSELPSAAIMPAMRVLGGSGRYARTPVSKLPVRYAHAYMRRYPQSVGAQRIRALIEAHEGSNETLVAA